MTEVLLATLLTFPQLFNYNVCAYTIEQNFPPMCERYADIFQHIIVLDARTWLTEHKSTELLLFPC